MIETDAHGLVLVDTGYGLNDVAYPHGRPHSRITRAMRTMLNIKLREKGTAIRQIAALGFSPRDVRPIVLTHLDFDHAGGLGYFPEATVHVLEGEWVNATGPRTGFVSRNRYRPAQLEGVRNWRRYGVKGEPWYGFDAVRDLDGLPPKILWCRCLRTHGGMPVWRSNDAMAGCSTPAMPISVAMKCGRPNANAPPAYAPTRR